MIRATLDSIKLEIGISSARHASYIAHSQCSLLTQRISQIGCGYEDSNDSNCLRHVPMCKLGPGRLPSDGDTALASAATMFRFEYAASSEDIYRVSEALVEQFLAGVAPRHVKQSCKQVADRVAAVYLADQNAAYTQRRILSHPRHDDRVDPTHPHTGDETQSAERAQLAGEPSRSKSFT